MSSAQRKRENQNRNRATATAVAEEEPAQMISTEESDAALKRTSMYKCKNEMFPILEYDFDSITLNQPFIVLSAEELDIIRGMSEEDYGKICEGSKIWISDGERMILTSVMTRDGEWTLTIHWLIRQKVVVRGDSTDLEV